MIAYDKRPAGNRQHRKAYYFSCAAAYCNNLSAAEKSGHEKENGGAKETLLRRFAKKFQNKGLCPAKQEDKP